MLDYRKLRSLSCVLALALALAACGGGSGGSDGPASMMETDPDPAVEAVEQRAAITAALQEVEEAVDALDEVPTEVALAAAEDAVEAARAAVMDADALSTDETDNYDRTISLLERRLAPAAMRIATARVEEARDVLAAFDGPGIGEISATVAHGTAPVMTGTIFGSPLKQVTGLETAAAGGSVTVGAWRGGAYTASDEVAGVQDRIVFHTDIAAPGTRPFSGEGGKYDKANGLDGEGNLPIMDGIDATLIASSAFPTAAGIREHPGSSGGAVLLAGTFDGAQGAYACTPAAESPCTSSVRHGGGITLAGGAGGWTFRPAEGATVLEPDGDYRYFGWWLREAGGGRFIGAFHAGVGADANEFASLVALQGEARYSGPAAGMVVIGDEDGSPLRAEAFTALAVLTADFGDDVDAGTVEGVVEEFLVDGESMPWSVALRPAVIYTDGTAETDSVTVWTIDGMEEPPQGAQTPTWRGQFHEAAPDHVPTAATGSFEASFGKDHRMIGAFGASRQQ